MMHKILSIIFILLICTCLDAQENLRADELKGLAVGAQAPIFKAIDADGKEFDLSEALHSGPVVLVFYRGFWCPYCNKHLETFQDSLYLIEELGARVVAISPEKPEYLEKMADKTGAGFTLLYDEDYKIEDAFGLTFTPAKMQLGLYNVFLRAKLKKSHSDKSQRLPIPATFIIDSNAEVLWRHFDPNYKKRSSVKDIVRVLKMIR